MLIETYMALSRMAVASQQKFYEDNRDMDSRLSDWIVDEESNGDGDDGEGRPEDQPGQRETAAVPAPVESPAPQQTESPGAQTDA